MSKKFKCYEYWFESEKHCHKRADKNNNTFNEGETVTGNEHIEVISAQLTNTNWS